MNELIEIGKCDLNNKTIQTVNARSLHEFLGNKDHFATWIKDRIKQYGFVEGVDYVTFSEISEKGGRPSIEYHPSIDMAKELAMVERNEKGKQARQYFIECERKAQAFALSLPQTYAEALRALADESEKSSALQSQIEQDRPKVVFADAVSVSADSVLVGDLAKLMRQNGFAIGQNRLFARLREDHYLMKNGSNMPTQRSMELGIMEVHERAVSDPAGVVRVFRTTKITGKGQQYFINRYCLNAQEA